MELTPFRCVRPVPRLAERVVSLPYGSFDRERAFAEAASNPLSFLAVDWPETMYALEASVDPAEARLKARELLEFRVSRGVLEEDGAPCLYLYEMRGDGVDQTAVVGAVPASSFEDGTVRRHELTIAAREADRAAHIADLGAQTGPVFLAFRASDALRAACAAVKAGEPLLSFTDSEGLSQRVWRLEGERAREMAALFSDVPCAYIADGHHRAASALRCAESAGSPVLCALFPSDELRVLRFDRLVAAPEGWDEGAFLSALQGAGFSLEASAGPVAPERRRVFGLCLGPGRWYRLEAPEDAGDMSDPVSALDVSVLQDLVLGPLLGIEDPRSDPRLSFAAGPDDAAALEGAVASGEAACAFTLFPTSIDEVMAVADAGEVMPPKSTWFEPKPRGGLFVMRT